MNNLKSKFGTRLKKLRIAIGFTQEELAEKCGVSVEYISSLERGLYSPSFETIEKLSKAIQVSPKALFDFDNS